MSGLPAALAPHCDLEWGRAGVPGTFVLCLHPQGCLRRGVWASGSSQEWVLSCFSRVRLCATPEMTAHQAPPSLGFSRQEHWSGVPLPSPMHESEKSAREDGGVSGVSSSCGARGGFLPSHFLKFAQVRVHCIGDAIQPSNPLSSPSPPVVVCILEKEMATHSSVLA